MNSITELPSNVNLLPHNREAEQLLLGTLLYKPEKLVEATSLLTPDDFYVGANHDLFSAMLALHGDNRPWDIGALVTFLHDRNKLQDVGGPEYLQDLCDKVSAASIAQQAKTLTELSRRRKAIELARKMAQYANPPTGTLTELIDTFAAEFAALRDDSECGWERPLPIQETPDPEPFPIDVFPPIIQSFIKEASASLVCPVDYVGVSALVFAAGAIGASECIEIKEGWRELPALYAAIIGPPGSTKTPALATVAKPLESISAKLVEDYTNELNCHKQNLELWEKDKSGPEPVKPIKRRAITKDVTVESLAPILRDNPRGVVLFRDELIGWVKSMNQYKGGGKGSDRQFYLSAWSGVPFSVDRSKDQDAPPLMVCNPFLCVVGGLPPAMLPTLRGDSANHKADDDGFFDRLLFSYPKPFKVEKENWQTVSPHTKAKWYDVINQLYAAPMVPAGDDGDSDDSSYRPKVVKLSLEARTEWERLTGNIATDMESDGFQETLRAVWSKMRTYAARFALVIHCLRNATGEQMTAIDGQSVRAANKLAGYFLCQARRVFSEMEIDTIAINAAKVRNYFLKEARNRNSVNCVNYSVRDIQRKILSNQVDCEQSNRIANFLEEKNYIKYLPIEKNGRGRNPSRVFKVNPILYSGFN